MTSAVDFAGADAAVQALALALREGAIAQPGDGRVLFLRARAHSAMQDLSRPEWVHVQTFKPHALALEQAGCTLRESVANARFPLVLALPPRQRDEARALLARAVTHTEPGGVVAAAMPNAEGARSGERDLDRLAGPLQHFSKHKCRVFWTAPLQATDPDHELLTQWLRLDAQRPIHDGRLVSRPGLFAWDRIDPASALLAAHLPADLRGRVADLGAGYGFLACEVLRNCPRVSELDLYEAESRALEPAQCNIDRALAQSGRSVGVTLHWHDVTGGLPQRYNAIVSNPPFHLGRANRPELGQAFIRSAADALMPGGRLLLVANRHLPYESVLAQRFARVRVLADERGFKVIEAVSGRRK